MVKMIEIKTSNNKTFVAYPRLEVGMAISSELAELLECEGGQVFDSYNYCRVNGFYELKQLLEDVESDIEGYKDNYNLSDTDIEELKTMVELGEKHDVDSLLLEKAL